MPRKSNERIIIDSLYFRKLQDEPEISDRAMSAYIYDTANRYHGISKPKIKNALKEIRKNIS